MRILQINKFFWPKGGADRYMIDLSALLTKHGHEVIPFAMADKRNLPTPYAHYFPTEVKTEDVSFGIQGARTFGRLLYARDAKKAVRTLIQHARPDLAHIHNVYTQLSPSVIDALREEGIPTVMTIHDYHLIAPNYMLWAHGRHEDLSHRSLASLTLSRFHKDSYAASFAQALSFKLHRTRRSYERGVERFIAPSNFVLNEHVDHGFDPASLAVIPPFTPQLNAPPRFDDDGYILYTGRLVHEKGVEVLLKAMHGMPGVPCKIVGTGPEEHNLHIIGDRMPNVTFEGYKTGEALSRLVSGARAVVVPSLWSEVFGLVAIEAMALGKPVIASSAGALPEIVVDRVTGFLVPPADVRALREAIMRLAEDPVLATQFGRAGRTRAEQKYAPEGHYRNIMNVYEAVARR